MQIFDVFLSVLGKISATLVLLGSLVTGTTPPATVPEPEPVVLETIVQESSSIATSTSPEEIPAEASPAPTSTVVSTKPVSKPPVSTTPATTTTATPTVPKSIPPPEPTKSEAQVNTDTRAALVNILCTSKVGINGISGSGVIIDSRGIILTNAHIGQFFLLRDYITRDNVTCTIRIGSPAEERYLAELLYLPPAWIDANATQLKAIQATGTGEHDYAFLRITGRTDPNASLPETFPRIEMDRGFVDIGDPMLLAAYPAGFLSSQIVQKSLYISSAIAYVTQLFSYDTPNKVDLFSIGGSVVSQGGSSGGAAVRLRDGKLMGLISTATNGASTENRDLRAISLSHINNSLAASGEGGMIALLWGDVASKAAIFASTTGAAEKRTLEKTLKGN